MLLGLARFCVRFLPFKWYVSWLGASDSAVLTKNNIDANVILLIRKAISRAANNAPWNTVCLPQAIAAKWMCKRRKIHSVMYLGVAKKTDVNPSEPALNTLFSAHSAIAAHAWLTVNEAIITGEKGHKKFTVIKRFYS